jgi:predicted RNase H-like nuclease (RuvC/YqgF family)
LERKHGESISEIERLHQSALQLKKKGKEEIDRHTEVESRRGKEIANLTKRIKDLERGNKTLENSKEALRKRIDLQKNAGIGRNRGLTSKSDVLKAESGSSVDLVFNGF